MFNKFFDCIVTNVFPFNLLIVNVNIEYLVL